MPKHTIAFFDVTDKERSGIKKHFNHLDDTQLVLISDPVSTGNISQAKDADVVSIFVSSKLDKAMLDQLPNLKSVACRSTGFNNVDPDEAQKRGIIITNVPSYGEHTVAEYTFLLMLAVCRQLIPSVQELRDNHVNLQGLTGLDLNGKTLGVVGTGKIGLHTIKIAKGFEMNVLGYDLYPNEAAAKQLDFKYAGFEELLSEADIVSLHAPYVPENHHLMNAKTLSQMKPGSILLNTARGELVDSPALLGALKSGHLAGAGLDVLEGESHKEDQNVAGIISELEQMPNVLLTPHNAFNTKEATARILKTSLENISSFLKGDVVNQVGHH